MAYGISIVNNSGFVQIDEEYSNYRVVASGTAAGSPNVQIYYPDYGVIPLIMVRPVTFGHRIATTGIWYTDRFTAVCTSPDGPTGQSFYYKVLVPVKSVGASAETFGLRVYNSSGQINFDSGHTDQLRVSAVSLYQPLTADDNSYEHAQYVTVPASTGSYYTSLNGAALVYVDLQQPAAWVYMCITQTSENNFVLKTQTMHGGQGIGYVRNDPYQTFIFGTFL